LEVKKEENNGKDVTEKSRIQKPETNYTHDHCLKCNTRFPTNTKHECGKEKPADNPTMIGVAIDLPVILFIIKLIANFFILMGFSKEMVAVAEQRNGDIANKFFQANQGKAFAEFTKVEPAKRKVDQMVVQ